MKELAHNPIRAFRRLGISLPLRVSESEVGEVLDDKGVRVLTVDPDGALPDDDAADDIAAFLVLTVNAAVALRGAVAALDEADSSETTTGGQG